jgi:hypothetical protein
MRSGRGAEVFLAHMNAGKTDGFYLRSSILKNPFGLHRQRPLAKRLISRRGLPDSNYLCSFVFIRVSIALRQLALPVTGKQIWKHG